MKKIDLSLFKMKKEQINAIFGGERVYLTHNTGGGGSSSYTNSSGTSCQDEYVGGGAGQGKDIEWYDNCEKDPGISGTEPSVISIGGVTFVSSGN